ncbi:MAG: nucleotidyltransferase family protein [Ruminococcus sp.]|nr:nucleotidyltransferase family protein [Ruminococcus sp.]
MNKHDYKQNAYYLIYLIRCVLNKKIPSKEKLGKMDLSGVFAVAQAHSLTAIAAYALESAGIYDKDFEEEKARAIRKTIILDTERERVFSEFDKAGIWYMPLKGIILKDYYPAFGMRQMADNDILIDRSRQEDIKRIMLSCGFYVKSYDKSKHDVYFKEPVCNFQMHVSLFEEDDNDALYTYYKNIDKRLLSDGTSKYGRSFTKEDYYLYIKAHEYRHYNEGGTGLRNLVDIYVLLNEFKNGLDWDYIKAELSKLGMTDYESDSRKLALKLFDGVKLTDSEKKYLDYFIFSGTYGNTKNNISNALKKNGGSKARYIIDRLIPPMYVIKKRYPMFYKHRMILPFLPVYRLAVVLVQKRGKISYELKTLIKQ